MKPALRYYGGKQKMIPYIEKLIPKHDVYVEPFAGGATVLFHKKKSKIEILNDNLVEVVNFYRVMKNKHKFKVLLQLCMEAPYARSENQRAQQLYKTGNEIERAWATWMRISTGFSGKMDGSFSVTTATNSSRVMTFHNYKNSLEKCSKRIEFTVMESLDALECIRRYDGENVFFYLDPPYLGADQGHYKGYTEQDFYNLLFLLKRIKGKFLLSCYPGVLAEIFTEKTNNINLLRITQRISAANSTQSPGAKRMKTEMLIWNYYVNDLQGDLFDER